MHSDCYFSGAFIKLKKKPPQGNVAHLHLVFALRDTGKIGIGNAEFRFKAFDLNRESIQFIWTRDVCKLM